MERNRAECNASTPTVQVLIWVGGPKFKYDCCGDTGGHGLKRLRTPALLQELMGDSGVCPEAASGESTMYSYPASLYCIIHNTCIEM